MEWCISNENVALNFHRCDACFVRRRTQYKTDKYNRTNRLEHTKCIYAACHRKEKRDSFEKSMCFKSNFERCHSDVLLLIKIQFTILVQNDELKLLWSIHNLKNFVELGTCRLKMKDDTTKSAATNEQSECILSKLWNHNRQNGSINPADSLTNS